MGGLTIMDSMLLNATCKTTAVYLSGSQSGYLASSGAQQRFRQNEKATMLIAVSGKPGSRCPMHTLAVRPRPLCPSDAHFFINIPRLSRISLADSANSYAMRKLLLADSPAGRRGGTHVSMALNSAERHGQRSCVPFPSSGLAAHLQWGLNSGAGFDGSPSSRSQRSFQNQGRRSRMESQFCTRAFPEFFDWTWQLPDEGIARDFLFASLGATVAFTLATAAAWVWHREETRLRETSAERGLAALPEPSTTAGQKESVEWVNMVLQKIWRIYRRSLEAWLVGLLQPAIDQLPLPTYVRRVEIAELSLNYDPILVRNVQRRASRQANDLQYHIGLRYTGGARCVLKLHVEQNGIRTAIPVGVRDLDVDGEMWVKLRLTPRKPYVGTLSIAFVRLPTIKLVLAPFRVVNVFAIPFLSRFLSKLLTVDLPRLLVLPRTLTFDFLPSGEGFSTGPGDSSVHTVLDLLTTETLRGLATQVEEPSEHFVGELTVTVCDAHNLPTWNLSGWSNPFCVLTLGDQVVESKRNRETSHPAGSTDPVWNQDFQFWVEDPLHQKLTVRIRDAAITLHPDIGYIEIPTWQLQDCVPMSVSLPLMRDGPFGTKPVQGELRLLLTYKSYVDEEADQRKRGLDPPLPIVIKVFSDGESSDESDKSSGPGSDSDSDSDSASRAIQVDNEELALADAAEQTRRQMQTAVSAAAGIRDGMTQEKMTATGLAAQQTRASQAGQVDTVAGDSAVTVSQRESASSSNDGYVNTTADKSAAVGQGSTKPVAEAALGGAAGVAVGVGQWIASVAVPQAVTVGDQALRGSVDAGKWAVGATLNLWGKWRKERSENAPVPDVRDVSEVRQEPDRRPDQQAFPQQDADGHMVEMDHKVQPAYLHIPDSNVLSRLNDELDSSDDESDDGTRGGGASRARQQELREGGWGDGESASEEGGSWGRWTKVVGRGAGRLTQAGAATWGWVKSVLPGEKGDGAAAAAAAAADNRTLDQRDRSSAAAAAASQEFPPSLPPFISSVREGRVADVDYGNGKAEFAAAQRQPPQQSQPRKHWYDERPDDSHASLPPVEPVEQQQKEHLDWARAKDEVGSKSLVAQPPQEAAEVRALVVSRLESSLVRSPSGPLPHDEATGSKDSLRGDDL